VAVTQDQSAAVIADRAKMKTIDIYGIGEDVELDDGHVYRANFAWSVAAGGNMPPGTGDDITLCELKSTDASTHYALRYRGTRYAAQFVR
jgi:hypothetical protein